MAAFLVYITSRLKEPSSYAGLASLFGLIGLHFTDGQVSSIVALLVAAAGAVAVFVPETTKPKA